MTTTSTNQTTSNAKTSAVVRKKLNAEILKTADMDEGDKFVGVFQSFSDRPWVDKETGEEKMIPQYLFTSKENPDLRTIVMGDAGFKNAFLNAGVEKGDWIEFEKLETKDIGKGRRVNQYDIYQLTNA